MFGRQLGMTLIRQPNGKQTYQALSADLKKMPGLTASATVKVKGKDGGKTVERGYTVATASIKEGELKPADTAFPAGFDTLDPENVAAAAKAPVKAGASAAPAPELVDVLRALIIGATPAALVAP
jgi:hypothetical protein